MGFRPSGWFLGCCCCCWGRCHDPTQGGEVGEGLVRRPCFNGDDDDEVDDATGIVTAAEDDGADKKQAGDRGGGGTTAVVKFFFFFFLLLLPQEDLLLGFSWQQLSDLSTKGDTLFSCSALPPPTLALLLAIVLSFLLEEVAGVVVVKPVAFS